MTHTPNASLESITGVVGTTRCHCGWCADAATIIEYDILVSLLERGLWSKARVQRPQEQLKGIRPIRERKHACREHRHYSRCPTVATSGLSSMASSQGSPIISKWKPIAGYSGTPLTSVRDVLASHSHPISPAAYHSPRTSGTFSLNPHPPTPLQQLRQGLSQKHQYPSKPLSKPAN